MEQINHKLLHKFTLKEWDSGTEIDRVEKHYISFYYRTKLIRLDYTQIEAWLDFVLIQII